MKIIVVLVLIQKKIDLNASLPKKLSSKIKLSMEVEYLSLSPFIIYYVYNFFLFFIYSLKIRFPERSRNLFHFL
jgi:hypothetical protein